MPLLSQMNNISNQQIMEAEVRRQQMLMMQNVQSNDPRMWARYHGLFDPPQPVTTREIKIGEAAPFWAIPYVRYFVERIPAAKILIPSDAITAEYLRAAKEAGYSLRQQCDDLGIPWSARKLTVDEVSLQTIKAAKVLDPSTFAKAKPATEVRRWADMVCRAYEAGLPEETVRWVAFHRDAINADVIDFLRHEKPVHPSTKPETIVERSRAWHERQFGAHADNEARMAVQFHGKPKAIPEPQRRFTCMGYEFVALETYKDFADESNEMRHCIRSRYEYACCGKRFYSIRKNGDRVASAQFSAALDLEEIKGRCNAKVPDNCRAAAEAIRRFVATLDEVTERVEPVTSPKPTVPQRAVELASSLWTGRR